MTDETVKTSKFLSLVLRHRPDMIGLALDTGGWASVEDLLAACRARGVALTRERLEEAVAGNDKRRFSFSADGLSIRANQGHSVGVELGYESSVPPPVLYHGTAERNLASIRRDGIVKGGRHHVHLSEDAETARRVGARYGKPAVLLVEAARMCGEGHLFYLSANGVWLTDRVPPEYVRR